MATFSNADTGSKPADPYVQVNTQEADLKTKVTDLVSFVDKHKLCMLTTVHHGGLLASRAMALAAKVGAAETSSSGKQRPSSQSFQEANGLDLLFHTNTESGKTDDIANDADVNVAFITPAGEWASISGKARVETERAEVKKYYSPALKAWMGDLGDGKHDGGPEDPRIGIIRVQTVTAQYAVSSKGIVGSAVEFAKGVAYGEAPALNKLRKISAEEASLWRSSPQ